MNYRPLKALFLKLPIAKYEVREESMLPFLNPGDSVFVLRLGKLKIGDIVVLKTKNGKFYIKRVSKIKDDKYFLIGDNKKESIDSRRFGWIDKKDIVGKVIYKM